MPYIDLRLSYMNIEIVYTNQQKEFHQNVFVQMSYDKIFLKKGGNDICISRNTVDSIHIKS